MALFVDGPAATIENLADQDAGLLAVAQTTGIDVSVKLRLAQEEVRADLELWLIKPRLAIDMFQTEMLWRPLLRIEQVVATPPLKRWETMHALELTYRDAYFSQLVDRYQAKWQQYQTLTFAARECFIASGLGLVTDPLHQPEPPALASVEGPQNGGTFYASVSWVNAAGQEGAASEASSITIADGNLMTVSAVNAPENAAGFRVYAGPILDSMFRQNDVLLPIGVTYTYVPGQITQGTLPGKGQKPDFTRALTRLLSRG
ncbi:MAG TPA: hypothetical protein VK789_08100 [Bryobacteraceae bacterium]|jgi:hypothetical protein|nr:hypothetical protein [Bryobacteraceae bacterium]